MGNLCQSCCRYCCSLYCSHNDTCRWWDGLCCLGECTYCSGDRVNGRCGNPQCLDFFGILLGILGIVLIHIRNARQDAGCGRCNGLHNLHLLLCLFFRILVVKFSQPLLLLEGIILNLHLKVSCLLVILQVCIQVSSLKGILGKLLQCLESLLIRCLLDSILLLRLFPLILNHYVIQLQDLLGCLVHCLQSPLLRCLGRLECFFLCLFPSSRFRIHQFVNVIGYVGKTIKEGILCLLADTLGSLAHFLLRGAKSCSKLLTDLLAFFKVALEIKCGLELITYLGECILGCCCSLLEFALEQMFECITQSLDGCNGVLYRQQQHLQDGIAHTHNCCNHILECVLVLVGKVHNVVNDLGNPPGKFLNHL